MWCCDAVNAIWFAASPLAENEKRKYIYSWKFVSDRGDHVPAWFVCSLLANMLTLTADQQCARKAPSSGQGTVFDARCCYLSGTNLPIKQICFRSPRGMGLSGSFESVLSLLLISMCISLSLPPQRGNSRFDTAWISHPGIRHIPQQMLRQSKGRNSMR